MSQTDTAHAWWSRLRHQGLLLSPVVMVERYPTAPPEAKFPALPKLRDARTRFESHVESGKQGADRDQAAILGFTDSLLETFIGHTGGRLAKQGSIPENLTAVIRIGSRSETLRPHRVIFADEAGTTPAVLVMADTSPQVGRGRGRTVYSRFLELLRGTGHRLGLLANGQQFRLVYAGLDFESWCEWESDRWFDEGEGTEELCGLRQLLSPDSLKTIKENVSGLLDGVEESRKRQADLSSVLRENVRQAVELLLEEVSTANRTKRDLFASLMTHGEDRKLTDAEAHESLFQATVRVVMRLVVCLFAESRQLLPVNDPIYGQSYGVRSLYELLDEVTRYEGGTHALFNRQTAWHRLMALFRLIYSRSAHGAFPMRAYGGVLFRPGDENSTDAVARALHILEHTISVGDSTIYYVLRKLLRGPLPVIKGKSKTFVDGPVDYTDLRTEFIGLIYEGLLDYRLKRTDEQIGPQIFLNLGREPVLPLARLEDMLQTVSQLREVIRGCLPVTRLAEAEREVDKLVEAIRLLLPKQVPDPFPVGLYDCDPARVVWSIGSDHDKKRHEFAGVSSEVERLLDRLRAWTDDLSSDIPVNANPKPKEREKPQHADGPVPPNIVWWHGKSHEFAPRLWQILNYLWTRDDVLVEDLVAAVWTAEGEGPADSTIRSRISNLNSRLLEIGIPRNYSVKSGYVRNA